MTCSCQVQGMFVAAQVLAQSYFVPFGVKALAATTTSKGITSKIILMGTFTDQASTTPALNHATILPHYFILAG